MGAFFSTNLLSARRDFELKFGQNGLEEFPGQYDTMKLQNLYDTTMLVDTIRFLGFRNNDLAYNNQPALNNLAVLDNYGVRFKVGDMYLMRDYVPIGLLCSDFDGNRNNVSRIMGTGFQRASRQWKLPAPMLLKPHWVLECEIKQLRGPFFAAEPDQTYTFSVWVQYIGRLTDNAPAKQILYPYVMAYNPFLPVTQAWTNDRDLYNTLDRPVRVQRLIGRQYLQRKDNDPSPDELKYMLNHDTLAIAPDAMTMRIVDNFKYDLVPESLGNPSYGIKPAFAPFGLAMDMYRAQQPCNRLIYPLAFLEVEFNRSLDPVYAPYDIYPWIAAIGTQEADL